MKKRHLAEVCVRGESRQYKGFILSNRFFLGMQPTHDFALAFEDYPQIARLGALANDHLAAFEMSFLKDFRDLVKLRLVQSAKQWDSMQDIVVNRDHHSVC